MARRWPQDASASALGRTSGTGGQAKLSTSVQSTARQVEAVLAQPGTLASNKAAEKPAKAAEGWPSGPVFSSERATNRAVCSTWR